MADRGAHGAGERWRVFVSHTAELREFPRDRSYVAAVERAVAACGHVIVNMADFPAADLPPAQLCTDRVESCDVYIGVLGTRYGSPVRDRPGVSYTELEFEAATQAGLYRLVFMLDTEAEVTGIPPSGLIDLEFGVRQQAFRRRVQAGLGTRSFADSGTLGQLVERSLRELAERHQADEAPFLPVRLTPRPEFIAGRDSLLAQVDARLAADPARPGPRVAVLCGLGGTGKTTVAVEYAHRHLGEVEVCWQFAAEDPAVLAAQFAVLAAQLGARDLADARDPVAVVHGLLARAKAGWLVVFDNVRDLAAVEAFLPPAGPGQVLVTSQSQHWPTGWTVQVPVLDSAAAARFLVARTGDDDHETALQLAARLGGLPLALEQAAAYMQATGTSLARYLPLFRDRQADLLARGEAVGHQEDTAATLALALARLAREAPAASGLMQLLACLAPEPVPLGLLLTRGDAMARPGAKTAWAAGPLPDSQVAIWDAVAALRRYSLITPAGDELVQVHPLVQAITRAGLTALEERQWHQAAATVVEEAIPADARRPQAWPACAVLLPHARVVLDLTSGGIWQIARYLGYSGSFQAARDLFALIADAHQQSADYGPGHPRTLGARISLASWTGTAGDAATARDQSAALLPVLTRVLGSEHPSTLTGRVNLASWIGTAGDAATARDQLAALLPIRERVQGPEHPSTLTAHATLAYWTGQAGEAAMARDLFAALVPVLARVQGPEHPDTLSARANLAGWTGAAGDAATARDQFAAVLPVQERILGPEHPGTLTTRAALALWTRQAESAG